MAKYAKPHIYDKPYAALWCGDLEIRETEIDIEPLMENMWWLQEA